MQSVIGLFAGDAVYAQALCLVMESEVLYQNLVKITAYPPVLLPGKSHGWRSPVGCTPWDR